MTDENTTPVKKTRAKATKKVETTPSPEKPKTVAKTNSTLTEEQIHEERIKALDEAYRIYGEYLPARRLS